MATKRGPSLRARWLGSGLRVLREQRRKTLKDVADYMQRDASWVSRMEAGIYPARVHEVHAYLDFCEVSDAQQRQALDQLAKEARQSGWWEKYAEYESLADRIWLESKAVQIDSFGGMVIPGHFQLRTYAEATIKASDAEVSPEVIERDVNLRMERKERIHAKKSLVLNVILDESVLHRWTGGREVMRSQLLHLIELADRPKTRIAIIPFSAGAHGSPEGSFDVMKLEDPYPTVAYVFSPAGATFLEGAKVDRLASRFKRLTKQALSVAESKSRFVELAELQES